MMLLSVPLPRLYIHCHEFTTQAFRPQPRFLFICSYLFVTAAVWERENMCVRCIRVCVWVYVGEEGRRWHEHEKETIRKLEKDEEEREEV